MKLKRKVLFVNSLYYTIHFPADCKLSLNRNTLKVFNKHNSTHATRGVNAFHSTTIHLDPIHPKAEGSIPVSIRTPLGYQLIYKP